MCVNTDKKLNVINVLEIYAEHRPLLSARKHQLDVGNQSEVQFGNIYSLFPSSHDRTESKTADSPVRRPADFICFNSVPFANQLMLRLMSLVFFKMLSADSP